MKKFLTLFCAALMLIVASCSEEKIEPQLSEDLKTSANGYWDQFLSIHITTNYDDEILFYLRGTGGNIRVAWGDGSSDDFFVGAQEVTLEHDYDTEDQDYVIRVSGDIKKITGLSFFYDDLYVNEMHFGGLTNLKYLSMGMLQNGPPVVNLSKNKLIESVILVTGRLENIILPTSNKIRMIDISGATFSVPVLDRIIARVHDSVVNSPRSGRFNFPESWTQEEDDMSVVGPPSSYSINKLLKLRDKYGWVIYPNIP